MSGPVREHGGRHPLPDWTAFAERLGEVGIGTGIGSEPPTQVVIYDDSRFAFAARLWWMLRFLGHDRVAILDGGIRAWEGAGFPLETEVVVKEPRSFVPVPQVDWIVDVEGVKRRQGRSGMLSGMPSGTLLIDSRSPERYRGEVEPIDPIAGSIPGAVNAFWQRVTTEDGFLMAQEELAERWSPLKGTDEAVFYCGSGVTACVNLFALATLGYPMPKLYPGGWSDWCSYLDLPSAEEEP